MRKYIDLNTMNRQLTVDERCLIRWMLEHGSPAARDFLPQLERASVLPQRCPCGCASIDLIVEGHPSPMGGMNILADFVFKTDDDLCGVFVFEKGHVLAGLEVYGLGDEAPKRLPDACSLTPL